MTIPELCADLDITRSTFYDWRAKRKAPRCKKLPNGEIRIDRAVYEAWIETLEEVNS
ncbi:putative DNA-binding transcriptional regulator AlpA [Allocatelliglobosispora scoriae]|uniref:Putative DNA-binding transcriptional regulator AlpA n=1 Tax=Allocatelliglobosispora scoriae TaxID=643052 RepID=A0A841BYI2_9ACTN|nr:helix-turn-helix domain-containing protein [Allocatelliglobosispora scoriae]MBB5871983.1 putative DNA-binding transcriptional regulator AlpA [Allocatelliglobosispora scoriae]